MKRAPALAPLSRDHLKALLAAKALREARDSPAATRQFLEFWHTEQHHFRIEEEVLLPWWDAHAHIDHAAAGRVLSEHLALRADVLRLQQGLCSVEQLHDIGRRLDDHVRFEERELFPMIEQSLSADALEALGAAVAAAEADP